MSRAFRTIDWRDDSVGWDERKDLKADWAVVPRDRMSAGARPWRVRMGLLVEGESVVIISATILGSGWA